MSVIVPFGMPRGIHHYSVPRASGTSGFKVSADTMQVLFTWMDRLGHWYSLFSAFSLLDMFFGVLVVACLCYIACHLLSIVREVFLCVFRLYKKKDCDARGQTDHAHGEAEEEAVFDPAPQVDTAKFWRVCRSVRGSARRLRACLGVMTLCDSGMLTRVRMMLRCRPTNSTLGC